MGGGSGSALLSQRQNDLRGAVCATEAERVEETVGCVRCVRTARMPSAQCACVATNCSDSSAHCNRACQVGVVLSQEALLSHKRIAHLAQHTE